MKQTIRRRQKSKQAHITTLLFDFFITIFFINKHYVAPHKHEHLVEKGGKKKKFNLAIV